jgi:hypothetical protein
MLYGVDHVCLPQYTDWSDSAVLIEEIREISFAPPVVRRFGWNLNEPRRSFSLL